MKKLGKKVDEFDDKLDKFLESLSDEDKGWVGQSFMTTILMNVTGSHYEAMGFIELFKINYHKEFEEMCEEERKEKESKMN